MDYNKILINIKNVSSILLLTTTYHHNKQKKYDYHCTSDMVQKHLLVFSSRSTCFYNKTGSGAKTTKPRSNLGV